MKTESDIKVDDWKTSPLDWLTKSTIKEWALRPRNLQIAFPTDKKTYAEWIRMNNYLKNKYHYRSQDIGKAAIHTFYKNLPLCPQADSLSMEPFSYIEKQNELMVRKVSDFDFEDLQTQQKQKYHDITTEFLSQ